MAAVVSRLKCSLAIPSAAKGTSVPLAIRFITPAVPVDASGRIDIGQKCRHLTLLPPGNASHENIGEENAVCGQRRHRRLKQSSYVCVKAMSKRGVLFLRSGLEREHRIMPMWTAGGGAHSHSTSDERHARKRASGSGKRFGTLWGRRAKEGEGPGHTRVRLTSPAQRERTLTRCVQRDLTDSGRAIVRARYSYCTRR
eukprot:6211226-Prymnesium_polylepis.1